MRIVTWNCCRGNTELKIAAAMKLRPDVLLLQEAAASLVPSSASFGLVGKEHGIATLAFNGFVIDEEEQAGSGLRTRLLAPDGLAFDVVNVWTQMAPTYIADALSLLRAFDDALSSGDAVVAGDFNACGPSGRAYAKLLAEMERLGLASAYHSFHGVPHGDEPHATHYFQWKEKRPFHLDYCYVPLSWRVSAVEVGAYHDWAALSDHRPVVVDVVPAR
jgi:hypothetical protein